MAGIPLIDAAQGVLGLGEEVSNLINAGDEKRTAQQLAANRPKYRTSPEISQDLSLAESELNNGNTAAQNAYDTVSNQQFSNSTDAILKSGGSVNNIGDLYGNSMDGRLKLKMMRDNMRLQQIQTLSKAREAKANEEQTQWQVDEFAPWQDKVQANAAARQGTAAQKGVGLQTAVAGLSNADQFLREQNQFKLPSYDTNFNSRGYAVGTDTVNTAPPIQNSNTLTPRTEPFPSYGF